MIILINGGIGNQLFQLCYALELQKIVGNKIKLMPLNDKNSERDFGLEPFLKMFPDIKVIKRNLFFETALYFSILLKKIFKDSTVTQRFNPIYNFSSVHDSSVKPKNFFVFGYFQNKDLVSGVLSSVGANFLTALDSIEIDPVYLNRNIIHIRGGDYKHHDSIGILSSAYFRNSIAFMGLQAGEILCLTDDLSMASEICSDLGVTDIASSSTLSPHQSLKAMAYSNSLICANSTFSWWGGALSQMKGGSIAIPNPWFKSNPEDSVGAFSYPGFTPVDSKFI